MIADDPGRGRRAAAILAVVLMVVVAVALVTSRRRTWIVIENKAPYPLTGVSIEYPGGTLALGDIPSGTSASASFWIAPGAEIDAEGHRTTTLRLTPGERPPFVYPTRSRGPSFWPERTFLAHGRSKDEFLFWEIATPNFGLRMIRGVGRQLGFFR